MHVSLLGQCEQYDCICVLTWLPIKRRNKLANYNIATFEEKYQRYYSVLPVSMGKVAVCSTIPAKPPAAQCTKNEPMV